MCSALVAEKVRQTVSRRRFLGMAGMAAAAGVVGAPMASAAGRPMPVYSHIGVQDLTHVITPDFPPFPGGRHLEVETRATIADDGFYANVLTHDEHLGTHMDAPAHFIEGGRTAELIPAEQLFAPLAVIDISDRAERDPEAQVTIGDIRAWEEAHGGLPAGAFVAMYSGWEERLSEPDSYVNQAPDGTLHFPGFSPEAAEFLVDERDIVGIGVDTLSLDYGASEDFGAHLAVLSAGKYGLENLANLGRVSPSGTTIIVGGPTHQRASGGPSRVFAVYDAGKMPGGLPQSGGGGMARYAIPYTRNQ